MESHNKNMYAAYKASIASAERSDSDELRHWKYVKKEKINGKWKYWYDLESYKQDMKKIKEDSKNSQYTPSDKVTDISSGLKQKLKNYIQNAKNKVDAMIDKSVNSVKDAAKKTVNAIPEQANKVVDKALPAANKAIKDVNKQVGEYFDKNIYDTNVSNIDAKKAKIMKTKEWQDIVKREDPEYVKKNADGTKTYLIDDYMVKKKHVGLDIIDDIGNGRDITINKLEKDSLLAGAKDYVDTAVMMVGIVSKALVTKFKFSQGSYGDSAEAAAKAYQVLTDGEKYAEYALDTSNVLYDSLKTAVDELPNATDTGDLDKLAMKTLTNIKNNADSKAVEALAIKAISESVEKALGEDVDSAIVEAAIEAAIAEYRKQNASK